MTTLNRQNFIEQNLESGLSAFWKQIYKNYTQETKHHWRSLAEAGKAVEEKEILASGVNLLLQNLGDVNSEINNLRSRFRVFQTEINQETSKKGKHALIFEFCQYLGSNNPRLDRKALSRWLDQAAVSERWQSHVKDKEFYASYIMGRLAAVFDAFAFSTTNTDLLQFWRQMKIEQHLSPWLRYSQEPRVQLSAFKSISSMLTSAHQNEKHILSSELLRYTYRFSLDKQQPPELQIEALNLLAVADLNKAIQLIESRLARSGEQDQVFFRESISDLICLHYLNNPNVFSLADKLVEDTSPLVRQSVVRSLTVCADEDRVMAIVEKLGTDPSDSVFCYLATQLPNIVHSERCLDFYLHHLPLNQSYVRTRSLCHGLVRWLSLTKQKDEYRQRIFSACNQIIEPMLLENPAPDIQYLLMETREKLWANTQLHFAKLLSPILEANANDSLRLTEEQQAVVAEDAGKRWLAAHIGHRFSLQIGQKTIIKGDVFSFRFWRFLYEFRHPATDKRQQHTHVTGRIYKESHLVPSPRLAEVSQTTVPGEPYFHAKEGHARPFLPLLDQLLSALNQGFSGAEIVLHHVAGKTTITPPKGPWKSLKARLLLTFKYDQYARLRNHDYNADNPNTYINEVRKLGFTVECQGHLTSLSQQRLPVSPAVAKFFELGIPLAALQFFQDFQRYFVSVYQNTINHILFFALFMMVSFWGNHLLVGSRVKQARKKIPMTIGGWGTRGKSGTERLKAALVNSVGLATVSKTTGCEAMFLYSTRYGNLKEMFLFRPYDKATIWEQTFVTRMAAKFRSDVLCWECMGLTPRYIDILQQQWMQDDMVTITNCFPDHEDLQGPAGVDIPQVIARFISRKSKVWASEDNMLAFLEKEALQKQALLTPVNWLDIATIPEDLLARFPYQEHPANIALIAKMAEEMQMSRSLAIKEMADRVVPDIGVLQVFPYSHVAGRNMRFVNGMSANERYGALANWHRLGYDNIEQQLNGTFKLATVLNNRADRVPRSKVFARLIAYDFSATKHFVIGNNLEGFKMFTMEAWTERLDKLFASATCAKEFNHHCHNLMEFLQVPTSIIQLQQHLNALCGDVTPLNVNGLERLESQLDAVGTDVDQETQKHILSLVNNYQSIVNLLLPEEKSDSAQLSQQVALAKATFSTIFEDKIILVDDYFIGGEALSELIANAMPANTDIDILGLQNIKGPGLDFVYKWQQWQRVSHLLTRLEAGSTEEAETHANELAGIPAFSLLDREGVRRFLRETLENQQRLSDKMLGLLENVQQNLEVQMQEKSENALKSGLFSPLLAIFEELIDIFDAVIRGRNARKILIDLAAQRISLNQAAWLLMQINKRQKGGWLKGN